MGWLMHSRGALGGRKGLGWRAELCWIVGWTMRFCLDESGEKMINWLMSAVTELPVRANHHNHYMYYHTTQKLSVDELIPALC